MASALRPVPTTTRIREICATGTQTTASLIRWLGRCLTALHRTKFCAHHSRCNQNRSRAQRGRDFWRRYDELPPRKPLQDLQRAQARETVAVDRAVPDEKFIDRESVAAASFLQRE
jgi:hypothetical protein